MYSSSEDFRSSAWKKYRYILGRIWVQLVNIIPYLHGVLIDLPSPQRANRLPRPHPQRSILFPWVLCFLFFNLFATVGNFIAQYVMAGDRGICSSSVWRALASYSSCTVTTCRARAAHRAHHIRSDWMYIAGAVAMAVSSGYLSSLYDVYTRMCSSRPIRHCGHVCCFDDYSRNLLGINFSLLYPIMVTS